MLLDEAVVSVTEVLRVDHTFVLGSMGDVASNGSSLNHRQFSVAMTLRAEAVGYALPRLILNSIAAVRIEPREVDGVPESQVEIELDLVTAVIYRQHFGREIARIRLCPTHVAVVRRAHVFALSTHHPSPSHFADTLNVRQTNNGQRPDNVVYPLDAVAEVAVVAYAQRCSQVIASTADFCGEVLVDARHTSLLHLKFRLCLPFPYHAHFTSTGAIALDSTVLALALKALNLSGSSERVSNGEMKTSDDGEQQ